VMAYMREIGRCRCGRPAAVEVFSRLNASMGLFCRTCGKREAARLNRLEQPPADPRGTKMPR